MVKTPNKSTNKIGMVLASPQPNGSPQSPERPSAALGSAAACMSFRRSSVRVSDVSGLVHKLFLAAMKIKKHTYIYNDNLSIIIGITLTINAKLDDNMISPELPAGWRKQGSAGCTAWLGQWKILTVRTAASHRALI